MVKITVNEDCGNSPKAQFVKNFHALMAKGRVDESIQMMTDDVCLEVPGHVSVSGKEAVAEVLRKDAAQNPVAKLSLDHILSHGKHCAVDGNLNFANGDKVAFCTVHTFESHSKNARLKEVKTYSIILK